MNSLNNNLVDTTEEYYVSQSMQLRPGGHLFHEIICVGMFPLLHCGFSGQINTLSVSHNLYGNICSNVIIPKFQTLSGH